MSIIYIKNSQKYMTNFTTHSMEEKKYKNWKKLQIYI